jgi:hypothetical protein
MAARSSGPGMPWDHLIQDFDSSKANYGKVSAPPRAHRHQLRRLSTVATTGCIRTPSTTTPTSTRSCSACAPSTRSGSSTTAPRTAEAQDGAGGSQWQGRAPALPLRQSGRLSSGVRRRISKLFKQHDSHWIEAWAAGRRQHHDLQQRQRSPRARNIRASTRSRRRRPTRVTGRYPMGMPMDVWGPQQPTWSYEDAQQARLLLAASSRARSDSPTATR